MMHLLTCKSCAANVKWVLKCACFEQRSMSWGQLFLRNSSCTLTKRINFAFSPSFTKALIQNKICSDFYLWNPSGNVERSKVFVKAIIVLELKLWRKQKLVDCFLAQEQEDMWETYLALYASESVPFVVPWGEYTLKKNFKNLVSENL